jgi:ABC-type branched-subunit amino acid transport system ATPase component
LSASLTVRNLSAGYGAIDVLHGVDLDVPAGQITVLVGPNGAGKSTLVKALSGLIAHHGDVQLDGQPLSASPAAIVKAGLAHVPEGRHLFAQMSVADNLQLGAYLRPKSEHANRIERVFELFPKLHSRRHQYAGTMSGGEQQMLAVGRALMGEPRLLILDEPSLGLAPKMVDELLAIARRIRESGTTVLLVEQNVRKALAMGDRAYVLERGRMVLHGTASEVLASAQLQSAYLGAHGGAAI